MKKYDYIIAGAGCAGLSLALHMIRSGKFANKKVLIAEKDKKQNNDRTWCFWEIQPGLFEPIVFRKWKKTWFHSHTYSRLLDLAPYEYKMIRGIDFYNYCLNEIRHTLNFELLFGNVQSINTIGNEAQLQIDNEKISADYIFNSILFNQPELKKGDYYLFQHFRGWVIEAPNPVFNPEEATLMDFRVSQRHGTTFVYVKPFAATRALVEYTLFTGQLLEEHQYEEGLKEYIQHILQLHAYHILEKEVGVIPMTSYRFPAVNGRVVQIGTAGGQTKASSGYTFQFIQKHSARIVDSLIKKNNPFISSPQGSARFRFYDKTLLHILQQNKIAGDKIFTHFFKKNKTQRLLRFLDNESSFIDELKIISSLPTWPFLKAAFRQL